MQRGNANITANGNSTATITVNAIDLDKAIEFTDFTMTNTGYGAKVSASLTEEGILLTNTGSPSSTVTGPWNFIKEERYGDH